MSTDNQSKNKTIKYQNTSIGHSLQEQLEELSEINTQLVEVLQDLLYSPDSLCYSKARVRAEELLKELGENL